MVLNDVHIAKWAEEFVQPYDQGCVNPASYDLKLSSTIVEILSGGVIDASNSGAAMNSLTTTHRINLAKGQRYILMPGTFILASSLEVIQLPADLAGNVQLKSTIARTGVGHTYAGWIDPGFIGQVTFELFSHVPIVLEPGIRICQIVLHKMVEPSERVYAGRYQYQRGPTPTREEEIPFGGVQVDYATELPVPVRSEGEFPGPDVSTVVGKVNETMIQAILLKDPTERKPKGLASPFDWSSDT